MSLSRLRSRRYEGSDTKDDRWCNNIVLHDFDGANIRWREWFEYCLSFFTKHNLEPMRLGVCGKYYGDSAKTMTFKSGRKKLEKFNFEGITSLGFMVMFNKDDYTSNYIIDIDVRHDKDNFYKSSVQVSIDANLEPFSIVSMNEIGKTLQELTQAKYGYYFYRNLRFEPSVYSSGGNIYFLNLEEERLCRMWNRQGFAYDRGVFVGTYKTGCLRDIYLINFLSLEHLSWSINPSQNLQAWIDSNPKYGKLIPLNTKFWSWTVDEANIAQIKSILVHSGIVICY